MEAVAPEMAEMPTSYSKHLSLTSSLLLSSPLYVSVFLMRFSFGLVLFTLPIYLPKEEFSNLVVGLIAAAYPLAETILGPVVGILVDRFGRRKWIFTGLSLSTAVLLAFTLSTQVAFLIVIHAVQGVAAAMIIVSSLAMVTDISNVSTRGREMGIYDFANLGGYMIGILMAGILTRTHSLVAPFYFGAGLAAVGAVYAYLRVREPQTEGRETALSPLVTMRLLFTDRRAAGMFPIWLSVTTFVGMALTFGPRQGGSPLYASVVLAGIIFVLAFTQPFFGHLSDRYGRDRLMMLGMLCLIGLFVTAIAILRGNLKLLDVAPLVAIFAVGSFAFAPAALASLGDLAPERGRGTTMGVYSVVISLGTIIGPLLGGYLLDRYGLVSLFYAGLMILIAALGVAIIIGVPNLRKFEPIRNR